MILIGLTGIMGSGKSTVAALLRRRGFEVVDLDAAAKDSLSRKEALEDIENAFGPGYVRAGRVDVERLRQAAFTSGLLRVLEAIIHPRVREEVRRKIALLEEKGVLVVFIEHPLLFEVGFYRRLDKIVLVTAPMETIRERLRERGMEPGDIERRLSFQIPLEAKKKKADCIIDNSGTEDRLEAQIDALIDKITKQEVIIRCI
ncbi:MAG: dephospho-CoA kinase [Syntrophorhabdales bacterium]|jgi:dephospho-CoA kinase